MQQAIEELKQEVTDARNELNDALDEMEINIRYEIEQMRSKMGGPSSADDGEE